MTRHPMTIGLALGSGSARGWAHIGVINALADLGIVPDVICGTSIGALVGASYVSSKLDRLEQWTRSLTKFETARFFEINIALNGFVNTKKFHAFLNEYVVEDQLTIDRLTRKYAAVATDLETGREVWLMEGPVIEAVWSSISLPGLFPAIKNSNRWLVDGGLVNPVPVSVCRALGADIVLAVNLNGKIAGKHFKTPEKIIKKDVHAKNTGVVGRITDMITEYTTSVFSTTKQDDEPPGLYEAIAGSINIIQDRITRSRMAGDPPDILLSPRLSHIGLLEFYRATEAITEGVQCVQRVAPELQSLLAED